MESPKKKNGLRLAKCGWVGGKRTERKIKSWAVMMEWQSKAQWTHNQEAPQSSVQCGHLQEALWIAVLRFQFRRPRRPSPPSAAAAACLGATRRRNLRRGQGGCVEAAARFVEFEVVVMMFWPFEERPCSICAIWLLRLRRVAWTRLSAACLGCRGSWFSPSDHTLALLLRRRLLPHPLLSQMSLAKFSFSCKPNTQSTPATM